MDKIIKELGLDDTLNRKHFKEKVYNKIWLEIPHEEDYNLMADLMDLPTTSSGYKHLFCIVDLYTLEFDCEPVKNKTSQTVLDAMLECFKRKYVKKPYASLNTDGGSEFKSVFHKWVYDQNIYHKYGSPYRHKQQSVVESLNRQIAKLLMLYLNKMSKKTQKEYTDWYMFLPNVRSSLNEYRQGLFKMLTNKYKSYSLIDQNIETTPKFNVGQVVHYKLDYPENSLLDKQSSAKWREGDQRYSETTREIVQIIYMNSKPWYRYKLLGIPNISFSEYELIPANSKYSTFKVRDIIGKKIEKKIKYYLVWWQKELKKNATWEPEQQLLQDGLEDYIKRYEDEQKEKLAKDRQKLKDKQLKERERALRNEEKEVEVEKPKPNINVSELHTGRVLRSGKTY
jgi:hypothetical protein